MPASITTWTRLHSAQKFIESLDESYFFASKIDPWVDEVNPDIVTQDVQNLNDVKRQMIFMKKASGNGILGIKRFDWTSGTIYTPWESEIDLYFQRNWLSPTQPFYVHVQDSSSGFIKNNVYLCVDNNNGVASTIKPTGQSYDVFSTADGYKWRFMYDVIPTYLEYINSSLIPCPLYENQKSLEQIASEINADPGTINRIKVTNSGTGYTAVQSVTITGDGAGALAEAVIENNEIVKIIVTNPGVNYTYATVTITGNGSNATAKAIISPPLGHGSNPAHQLCATHIMTKQSFIADEGGLFIDQNSSFRRIGLIKNMKDVDGALLTGDAYSLLDQLDVVDITSPFSLVQRIVGTTLNSTARIFYINQLGPDSAEFYITDRKGNFLIDELVQMEGDPGKLAKIINITLSEVDNRSGDIIYLENIQFISRRSGRTESFIFSIEF